MAGHDLAALGRRLDKLTVEIAGDAQLIRTADAVGMMAKGKTSALSGGAALGGDLAFSGWRDKAGELMPLQVAFKRHKKAGAITIHRAPRSAGPWRVAQEGRNQGNASGIAGPGVIQTGPNAGTTRRRKDGKVAKVRRRKAVRWNGTTDGHDSWSQFEKAVEADWLQVVEKETRAAVARAVIG